MEFEEFVDLLDNYSIDYYINYDENINSEIVEVIIDDVNGISKEFEMQQNEIIDLLNKYPNLGRYTFYSENE